MDRIYADFQQLDEIKILDDMRKSTLNYELSDHIELFKYIESRIGEGQEVKTAFIMDSPEDTVKGVLFEDLTKSLKSYIVKLFSTPEAALHWLKS